MESSSSSPKTAACCTCFKANAAFACGVCESAVCKKCAKFLAADAFEFLPDDQVGADLRHDVYCAPCFIAKVEPALIEYNAVMDRAADVNVYMKDQGKESRLIRRAQFPVEVPDCVDREETLLRLAFLAARDGFNALVAVDIRAAKVRKDSYQTSNWRGVGYPAHVAENKNKSTRPARRSPSR